MNFVLGMPNWCTDRDCIMESSDEASQDGIMSGRTLDVASKIYSELQAMIRTHGDEVRSCKIEG